MLRSSFGTSPFSRLPPRKLHSTGFLFLYAGQVGRRSGYAQRCKLLKIGQLGGDPAFKLVAGEVATQSKHQRVRSKLGLSKRGTGIGDL